MSEQTAQTASEIVDSAATPAPGPTMEQLLGEAPMEPASTPPAEATDKPPVEVATPEPPEPPPAPEPEPAPEPQKGVDELSERFATLARQEREFQKERESFGKDLGELKDWQRLREQAARDPRAALKALGWDYEKLTDYHVNDSKLTADQHSDLLTQRIDELEAKLAEADKQQAAAGEKKKVQETLDEYRGQVAKLATDGGDRYKYLRGTEEYDLVLEVSEEIYARQERVPSLEESMGLVEEHLKGKAEQWQKVLGVSSEPKLEPKPAEPDASRSQNTTPVLTNDDAPAPTASKSIDEMDDEEALEFLSRRANLG